MQSGGIAVDFRPFAWLLLAVAANLVANFGLKAAIRATDTSSPAALVLGLLKSPWLYLGLLGAAALLASFMAAIRVLPLSTAYPLLTALAIVTMAVIEWAFQGVALGPVKMLGIALTVLGVALIAAHG